MVEFRKTPINKSQLPFFMVDHDVVGFDIAVHDTIGVAVVEGLEEFKDVEADVVVCEGGV